MHGLIADAVLVVHFLFILFVVGGEVCVIAGGIRYWQWVRNRAFRICHVLAIGIVIAQAWASQACPLTMWENVLREAAGQEPYSKSFIQYWVGRAVYYDAPQWVFTTAYSLFGAAVLASWIWVKPGRKSSVTGHQ